MTRCISTCVIKTSLTNTAHFSKKQYRPQKERAEWSDEGSSSDSDIIPYMQPKGRLIFDSGSSSDDKESDQQPPPFSTKVTNSQPSFLASLSGNNSLSLDLIFVTVCISGSVPEYQCDPSARIFRNRFQASKEQLARALFALFNKQIFCDKLSDLTPLVWNTKMRKTAAFCRCRKVMKGGVVTERAVRIELSCKVLTSADRLRDTLIHEMCHAATWIINEVSDGHGPFWKAWYV